MMFISSLTKWILKKADMKRDIRLVLLVLFVGVLILVFPSISHTCLPSSLLKTSEPTSADLMRRYSQNAKSNLFTPQKEGKIKLNGQNRTNKKKKYLFPSKMSLAELMKIPRVNINGSFWFTPQDSFSNDSIPKLSSTYRKQHGLPTNMSGIINQDYPTRIKRLQSFCASKKMGSSSMCGKDSDNCTYERIFVDENHKVVFCAIPKVASTAWLMKLLQMANKPYNSIIVKAWRALGELGIRSLGEYSPRDREDRLKNYFKFLFVRHPLTRLVSAFRNHIPNRYMTRKLLPKVMAFLNKTKTGEGKYEITFDDFVSYLTMSKGNMVDNKHWQTYGRLCRLCDVSYDFIGKAELLSEDAKYLFKKRFTHVKFVDQSAADFLNNAHRTYSDLETTQTYFSLLTNKTKDSVIRRYGDDMEMFGYKRSDVF